MAYLIGQHMWLMNITHCGQCVYTRIVCCNNNDLIVYTLYSPNLLWEYHKIMLCMWLTINLLVGVTSTNCSLGGIVHHLDG